ncbi:MAG: hypothetical protein FWD86_00975 [Firmicutes bacterium]|nr:hypothetical protein [Bacillota bacterium]
MKIFKRIYFCAIAILFLTVTIFGFVTASNAGRVDNSTLGQTQRDRILAYAEEIINAQPSNPNFNHLDDSNATRAVVWDILTRSQNANAGLGLDQARSQSATRTVFDEEGEAVFVYNQVAEFAPHSTSGNRSRHGARNQEGHATGSAVITGNPSYHMGFAATSVIGFAQHSNQWGPVPNIPLGNPNFVSQNPSVTHIVGDSEDNDSLDIVLSRQVNNIAVVVPGAVTRSGGSAEAILFATPMDFSRSGGGNSSAVIMGAFLYQIGVLSRHELNGDVSRPAMFDHDIIFLFTDASHDHNFGLQVFMDTFVGFGNGALSRPRLSPTDPNFTETDQNEIMFERIRTDGRNYYEPIPSGTTSWAWRTDENSTRADRRVPIPNIIERINLVVNFDSVGNGSSMILQDHFGDSSRLVSAFSSATGGLSSSLVSNTLTNHGSRLDAFDNLSNHNRTSTFDGFENLSAMSIVAYGNVSTHNSALNKFDRLSSNYQNLASSSAYTVSGLLNYFAGLDSLTQLNQQTNANYFTVLNMFTVRHSNAASYIFAVILILLLAGIFAANVYKKSFVLSSLAKGIFVQLITFAATMAILFVLYLGLGVLLVGLQAFTIQNLLTLVYSNAAVLIGYSLAAFAFMSLIYHLVKKFFAIKATDVVRGGAVLFGFLAIVLGFAYPPLGLLVGIPALLTLTTMLLQTFFKNDFARKFGFDIERLMIYIVPMLVFIAFILPSISIISHLTLTVLTPILVLPFMIAFAFFAPYTPQLKKVFDRLLGKLPQRTIRVQRTDVQKIEDKAKPGKFKEKSGARIERQKTKWVYRHGVGVAVVAVIAAVTIMLGTGINPAPFGGATGLGTSVFAHQSHSSDLKASSLLFVRDNHGSSLRIHDIATFRRVRSYVDGFSWDNSASAYTKSLAGPVLNMPNIMRASGNGVGVTVSTNHGLTGFGEGLVYIEMFGLSAVQEVRVFANQTEADAQNSIPLARVKNNGRDNINIRLPMGVNHNMVIIFDFDTATPPATIRANITQYLFDDLNGTNMRILLQGSGQIDQNDAGRIVAGLGTEDRAAMRFGVILQRTDLNIVL